MPKERQVSIIDRENDEVNRVTSLQSVRRHQRITASPYNVLRTDNYLAVEATATTAVTINLPALASVGRGFELQIKDTGNNAATNNITVDGSGAETIDGSATRVINSNRGSLRIISGVSGWDVL